MSILDLPLTDIGKYDMLIHKGSESMDALWFRILITALNAVLPIILMIAGTINITKNGKMKKFKRFAICGLKLLFINGYIMFIIITCVYYNIRE